MSIIFKGKDAFDGERENVGPWKRAIQDKCLAAGVLSYVQDSYDSIRPVRVTKELKKKAGNSATAATMTVGESQLMVSFRKQQAEEKKAAEQIQAIIFESITVTVRNGLKQLEEATDQAPLWKAREMFTKILETYRVNNLANDAELELRMHSMSPAKDLQGTIEMVKQVNDLHCLMHESAKEGELEKRTMVQMKLLIISKLPKNEITKEFDSIWLVLIQKLDNETQQTWKWLDLYKYLMEYLKQQKSYMSLAMSGTFKGGMGMQKEKEDNRDVKQVVQFTRERDSYKEELLQRMEMGRQAAEEYQSNGSQFQVQFIKGDQHQAAKTVCFEFRDKGQCRFGETCRFGHQGDGTSYIESSRDITRQGRDTRISSSNLGRSISPGEGSYYQQGGREDRRRSPSPKRSEGRREDRGRSRSPVTDRDDRKRASSPYPYPSKQIGNESQRVRY